MSSIMSRQIIPAIFLDARGALETSGGGVQMCNREFSAALAAAGFAVKLVPFELDRRFFTRIVNRARPNLRPVVMPPKLPRAAEKAVVGTNACFVFYGLTRFVGLSKHLRARFPQLRQVLLSHGVESVDFYLEQKIRRDAGTENRPRHQAVRMLGEEILREGELRQYIDAALVLSPFEAELEKWLGTPAVHWVPRTIIERPLAAMPVNRRVGCVSTLDHPPNHDGLVRLFDALIGKVPKDFRFRLVGRPDSAGHALAGRYPFVEYLGSMDDAVLRREASTWCCFVHPLFVYAKGCSTKLAVGLGWGIPVATTEFGARGYHWDTTALPLAQTPEQLAAAVLDRSCMRRFAEFQAQTRRLVELTPTLGTVAENVREFLLGSK